MSQIRQCAVDTIHAEADAVSRLATLLTDDFEGAVRAILACTGKVVVTGMGKSGLIGKKIAATLASTGTPAFFLHPGEAYHGDLGMISRNDIVLAMANSGQTDEILRLIPFMQRNGNRIIAMTGNPESTLAKNAHYHLNVNVTREACPMNLAPTSSTTAMLVMGDALAIALIRERNFRPEDYAVFHPGGSLGRRLLTRVRDVMRKDIPCVEPTATLGDVIIRISRTGASDGRYHRWRCASRDDQVQGKFFQYRSPADHVAQSEDRFARRPDHGGRGDDAHPQDSFDRRDRRERRAGRRRGVLQRVGARLIPAGAAERGTFREGGKSCGPSSHEDLDLWILALLALCSQDEGMPFRG